MSNAMQKFMSSIEKKGECWIWTRSIVGKGYGEIFFDGRRMRAHRFSYEAHKGPIPDGIQVCHNCPGGDNPACVNPDHLFLGTARDNAEDAIAKGRRSRFPEALMANAGRPDVSKRAWKLSEDDVRLVRRLHSEGERICDIARKFSVSFSAIADIVHGRKWTRVPFEEVGS